MSDCFEIINLNKSRALNLQILSKLCKEIESEHQALLHYTSVCWLLQGKVLASLLELQSEVKPLLNQNKCKLYEHLEDNQWIAKIAYMADLFENMN